MKYKCIGNTNKFTGATSDYLTVGKVYDFDMLDDDFGTTEGDIGNEVLENLTKQYHAQWEKVE